MQAVISAAGPTSACEIGVVMAPSSGRSVSDTLLDQEVTSTSTGSLNAVFYGTAAGTNLENDRLNEGDSEHA